MVQFDIIDTGDAAEEEARKTAARRMFMYSEAALIAAAEVDRKYVLFPDLNAVLTACDRAYQLALKLTRPQGIVVSGPPGSSERPKTPAQVRVILRHAAQEPRATEQP